MTKPKVCKIPNCHTESNKSIFNVPKNAKTREKWLLAIRGAYPHLSLGKTILICEKHFRPTDFTNVITDQNERIIQQAAPLKIKRLKRRAVPHFNSSPLHQALSTINRTSDSSRLMTVSSVKKETKPSTSDLLTSRLKAISNIENEPKPSTSCVSSSHHDIHVQPQQSTSSTSTENTKTISNKKHPFITRHCTIPNCHTEPNQSLYKLPSDPKTREHWLHTIRSAYPNLSLKKTGLICEKHFKPTDFSNIVIDNNGKIIQLVPSLKKKRLKRKAVPHFGDSNSNGVPIATNTNDGSAQLTKILPTVKEEPQPTTPNQLDECDSDFNKMDIQDEFGLVCDLCNLPWFAEDLKVVTAQRADVLASSFPTEVEDDSLSMPTVCDTCRLSLIQYSPKPANLPPLDPITERLVSSKSPFMQIRRLRREEASTIVGQAINDPVDVDDTMVTVVPRHLDDDQAFNRNIIDSQSHSISDTTETITDTSQLMTASKTGPITSNVTDSTRVFIDETGEIIQEKCLEPKRNISVVTNCTHVLIDKRGEIIQQIEKDLHNDSEWKMTNCRNRLKEERRVYPQFSEFQLGPPKPIFVRCDETGTSLVKEEEPHDPLAMEGESAMHYNKDQSSLPCVAYSGDSIGIKSESVDVKEELAEGFG